MAFIDTWVMSCRVLKRGIEYLALNTIVEFATHWGCDMIVGEYLPTTKNALAKNLYCDLGLNRIEQNSLGNRTFDGEIYTQLITSDQLQTHHFISA